MRLVTMGDDGLGLGLEMTGWRSSADWHRLGMLRSAVRSSADQGGVYARPNPTTGPLGLKASSEAELMTLRNRIERGRQNRQPCGILTSYPLGTKATLDLAHLQFLELGEVRGGVLPGRVGPESE